jgi:hypothetical protein
MRRRLAVAFVVVASLATGCFFDSQAGRRPARFHAGPNMRSLNVPVADRGSGPTARTATSPSPSSDREMLSATSASLQFTMQTSVHTYLGGEAETGRMERAGSNFAGAYGIAGMEHLLGPISVGAELAAGWRGLRYEFGDEEEDRFIMEPRVRTQLWFAKQWTLGASVGTRIGTEAEWMAGFYLGIHSQRF